jgi:arylsulfatase A-like enzyme
MIGALAAATLTKSEVRAQSTRPNFLFLFADDMGWGDVGFNGRKEWKTPNLDKLARQGTVFDRWYTAFPVCAPSRASLLTGRYTIHHGVRRNGPDLAAKEVTFAEGLKPHGYATALIGKWHRGRREDGGFTHPLEQGFDQTFGYLDARHAWEHFPKFLYRGREEEKTEGYSCDILVNEGMKFLRANRDKPFLLYMPFIEPHFYVEAPESDVKRYAGKFAETNPAEPHNARYAAMIERLDAAIGRVLAELDTLGLAQNTIVVFTSDNGATFESGNKGASAYHDSNHPFRGQKRSLEEGGIRMPSIVRWPGQVPAGRRTTEVVHMIDVMPTLLAAAGVTPDPAGQVDGVNMLDVWRGRSKAPDRTVFWELQAEGGNMYAAMRGDWKLLEIGGSRFLYNLKSDPQERRTLAAQEPEIFKRLTADLEAWKKTAVA